jgi:DtxR family transcriptional regulator, manganese transport regulator
MRGPILVRDTSKPEAVQAQHGADPLIDPQTQMESFRHAREARRSELVEDYVELIADLIDDGGEARKVDIAVRLGVAQPTVSKMINRLEDGGYITQKPYRGVFLTAEGRTLAEECRQRHQIVEAFLRAIGVSEANARSDSEGIEHHVSAETLEAFARFTAQNAVR